MRKARSPMTPIESLRLVDNAPQGLRPDGVAKVLVAALGRRLLDAPTAVSREGRAS